ncbi:DUF342 domain-containing protein [Bordetella bronchiseptica]|uniref:DUF342 domain-containing protein n=1 Tax=Bordetella bronchiseptica TaxID=518 RepID=UPI00045A0A0B|nr:FapA family protein [Bordetella bronchiseptica]KCV27641.1 PF03961 family protein [Bordetella bronchiseptica 00-P-2730]AUL17256.1 hypothetical protein BTL45_21090 [Bordetella bronchiseptica]AWP60489.1 hypothetical protein B7P02_21720 [Bordetella bronchiseptica]KAK76734.1 PF03961 family protein [Bordetella bronchiseptica CA90 BB02]KCV50961.1 PF03961 family protein [Bordetella bronchiseptica 7E71]
MTIANALQLELDEATCVLSAAYAPTGENDTLPTWDTLVAAVQARGWPATVLDQISAIVFIEQCRDTAGPVEACIGEVRNGTFELEVAEDRMSAQLSLRAPKGGKPVGEPDLLAGLQAHGIVHGLIPGALRQALERGACEALEIARGTPPQAGEPARFENLLDALKTRLSEDDENAIIDYRNLGNLTLVSAGTPLMRRTPATPGQPGTDVLGGPVAPPAVADPPFAPKLNGVEIDPEDPGLLRAAIAGSPMLVQHGATVNSLVEVPAVDLSSGNIDFEGTLRVKGDITAGMHVRVSGDVVVNGTIEAAHVEAGGNVTVNGGIIGSAEGVADSRGGSRIARIVSGGSVKARFIDNAEVRAEKNVAAEREIRQSTVTAGETITVGPPGSQQGVITGGVAHAYKSVHAGTLGSMAGMPTVVRAGLNPHANAKRAALETRTRELEEEKAKLEKLILFLHNNPAKNVNNMSERARQTHAKISADLVELQAEDARLAKELQPLETAMIVASRRFFGGVTLHLGVKVTEFLEDQVGGKAVLEQGELAIR